MSQVNRLPQGGRIDRTKPLRFVFDGKIATAAGVSDYEEVNVGFNLTPAMLSGKIDATLGAFWNYEGTDLERRGKDPVILKMDELGVPAYDELVRALEHGIRTILNYEPQYTFSTAANDTGLFNFRGIQAINYGSRDIRFQHTNHDLVSVNDVTSRVLLARELKESQSSNSIQMDMLLGIGGSPEAVTTACALKCLGGDLQCRYWPRNDKERELAEEQVEHNAFVPLGAMIETPSAAAIAGPPPAATARTADASSISTGWFSASVALPT